MDPDAEYTMVGVLNRGRGLFERGVIRGHETKYARLAPLRPGDLVFSKLFAWEGSVAVVDRHGWVSSEFPTYEIDQSLVDTRYLAHVIRWDRFVDQLANSTSGLGQRRQRVAPSRFEAATIPLPDLDTQRKVTARIERFARALAAPSFQRSTGPESASVVAPRIVSDTLHALELPAVIAGSLYEPINDVVHPGQDAGEARRFVGLEHIEPHVGSRIGQADVEDLKGRKLLRFAEGDVLYGYLRPYLNKVWVADGPGLCSVEQYVLRPRPNVHARLLAHVLRMQTTLDAVNAATHSLQLPRIRSGLLSEIAVPDIRLAADDLADRLDSINDRAKQAARLALRAQSLISSLLPAARNEEFRKLLAS